MKIQYIIPVLSIVCSSLTLHAQKADSTLTREMLLEREYSPTIREASRLHFLPEIKEPQIRKEAVEYSNYATPFSIEPQIAILASDAFYTDDIESKHKGYAGLGIASNLNINGDLGYRILNKAKTQLDVYASHRSANSNVKFLQSEQKQKMKMSDTWAALSFQHQFEPVKFFTDIKYTYSAFNYYGDSIPNEGILSSSPTLDRSILQVNNIFNWGIGVASNNQSDWNYNAKFSLVNFDRKYAIFESLEGPKELITKLDADVNSRFSGDNKYGLAASLDGFFYDYIQLNSAIRYYSGYKDYMRLAINPYIEFSDLLWKVHLGAKLYTTFNNGRVFAFAPDLSFSVYSDESELYLKAGGGVNANSNYTVSQSNRYVSPQHRIVDSRTPLDGEFGYKMNIQRNFWFDVYVGYQINKDTYFFRAEYPASMYPGNKVIAANVAVADTMDANLFKVGVRARYQVQDFLEFGLKAQFNEWDVDNYDYSGNMASKAWNKPVFECEFTAGYKLPGIPFRMDLFSRFENGRKACVVLPTGPEVKTMKCINDVSVMATYAIDEMFSIYGRVNNLLFQRYDLWYGYPAQGTNFMLGVNLKF